MAARQESQSWTARLPRAVKPGSLPLAVLVIPTLMLSIIAAGNGSLPGDLAAMLWIQDRIPQDLAWLFETVNTIGGTLGAVVISLSVAGALIASRNSTFAALMLLTLPVRGTNALLKLVAGSPRPPDELVRVTESASGLGFPSGHVMGATLLYGMLFILASSGVERRPVRLGLQVAASIMLILAGVSRIYVGAHWPSDVLGGYLFGAVGLLVILTLAGRLTPAPLEQRYR